MCQLPNVAATNHLDHQRAWSNAWRNLYIRSNLKYKLSSCWFFSRKSNTFQLTWSSRRCDGSGQVRGEKFLIMSSNSLVTVPMIQLNAHMPVQPIYEFFYIGRSLERSIANLENGITVLWDVKIWQCPLFLLSFDSWPGPEVWLLKSQITSCLLIIALHRVNSTWKEGYAGMRDSLGTEMSDERRK